MATFNNLFPTSTTTLRPSEDFPKSNKETWRALVNKNYFISRQQQAVFIPGKGTSRSAFLWLLFLTLGSIFRHLVVFHLFSCTGMNYTWEHLTKCFSPPSTYISFFLSLFYILEFIYIVKCLSLLSLFLSSYLTIVFSSFPVRCC